MPMFNREGYFRRLVEDAYRSPGGPSHLLIRHRFNQWFGSERDLLPTRLRRAFVHRTLKAARGIAGGAVGADLGVHAIGIGDLKIRCLKTDTNTASVFLFGQSDNLALFRIYAERIAPGSAAIDVGANVGMHALVMSRQAGPEGLVYAFEPSEALIRRLRENLAINGVSNVTVIAQAAGARTGVIGFIDRSAETNIGKSSVDASGARQVPVARLDDVVDDARPVSLIKIDVEGYELEVLRGAASVLRTHRPAVVMEFNADAYRLGDVLQALPYEVAAFRVPDTLRGTLQRVEPSRQALATCNLLLVPTAH